MGRHISTYGDLQKYAQYLIENFPLEALNIHLQSSGFKYIISEQCFDKNPKKYNRLAFKRPGNNNIIDHDWLSL
jgi:hypothetical protein